MDDSTDLSGSRGWLLVGLVVLTLVAIPVGVWYLTIGTEAGYGIYVALAMIPGLLFGAIGVWSAFRHR